MARKPQNGPRRGLRRPEAAHYLGIGPTLFDEMVRDGLLPKPKMIRRLRVWDRVELDIYFEGIEADGESQRGRSPAA